MGDTDSIIYLLLLLNLVTVSQGKSRDSVDPGKTEQQVWPEPYPDPLGLFGSRA